MKKIRQRVKKFFFQIDWTLLRKSSQEVLFLTVTAILPLIVNIIISWHGLGNLNEALKEKIIPWEILAYCLSFIAPSIYLIIKTHGISYRLPFLHAFYITTFIIYSCAFTLYVVAKNKWMPNVDKKNKTIDDYLLLILIFLGITILFRIYSIYHGKKASSYSETRNRQQEDFNSDFQDSLN